MPKTKKNGAVEIGHDEIGDGNALISGKHGERVVLIDPTLLMDRLLHYREKHSGWNIFRFMYWSIYLIVIAMMLIYYDELGFTQNLFFGTAILILAIMLILFGLTEALHNKFLQKYG